MTGLSTRKINSYKLPAKRQQLVLASLGKQEQDRPLDTGVRTTENIV